MLKKKNSIKPIANRDFKQRSFKKLKQQIGFPTQGWQNCMNFIRKDLEELSIQSLFSQRFLFREVCHTLERYCHHSQCSYLINTINQNNSERISKLNQ